MTTSTMSRRSLLAGAAIVASASIPSVANAANSADDNRLFELVNRWRELGVIADLLAEESHKLRDHQPSREWTQEELTIHRINGREEPHFVSLDEIMKSDEWDSPQGPESNLVKNDDGITLTLTLTSRRRMATEEELAAWHDRCAARRALYDAKLAAHDEAYRALGLGPVDERLDAADEERENLVDEIKAYQPRTLAGALEKMRIYREYDTDTFGAKPDDLDWSAKLFLTALADLERVAGADGRVEA